MTRSISRHNMSRNLAERMASGSSVGGGGGANWSATHLSKSRTAGTETTDESSSRTTVTTEDDGDEKTAMLCSRSD